MRRNCIILVLILMISSIAICQSDRRGVNIPIGSKSVEKKENTNKVVYLVISKKEEKQGLSTAEWVSIGASLATIIYTILTYFLLRETQGGLLLSAKLFKENKKRLETETINQIYRNFKDTYSMILNDKVGIKILSKNHNTSETEVKNNMFSSFLINNIHEIYSLRENGFLPDETWENYLIDIKELFSFDFVLSRWGRINKFYPQKFQEFINENILK